MNFLAKSVAAGATKRIHPLDDRILRRVKMLVDFLVCDKAPSRLTASPLGLVTTSCCAPGDSAGLVSVRVFMSLKATATFFPPRVTLVPAWKPLPRSVIVVPPVAGPIAGFNEPALNGTLASRKTVRPEEVRAKRRWPSSSIALALKRRATSVPGVTANGLVGLGVTPTGKALSETCT